MPYTFQSVKSMEILTDSSKLYNFIEDFSDYGNQFSIICSRMDVTADSSRPFSLNRPR